MNPLLLGPLFEIGKSLIDRLFPDPAQRSAAELELLKLTQAGDLQKILAQLEINAREAQHPSLLVAGWRPAVGWVGALGFLYAAVCQPLLAWWGAARGWPPPPALDSDLLLTVLGGVLGLGALRTVEKSNGVTK